MPHYNVNPVDGALFATGHPVGSQHPKAWKTEVEAIQRVRGETLTVVFEVESSVDYAIDDCLLPGKTMRSPGSLVKRDVLLQNEILTHLDFRTKIDIMHSLLDERFPQKADEIKSLIS